MRGSTACDPSNPDLGCSPCLWPHQKSSHSQTGVHTAQCRGHSLSPTHRTCSPELLAKSMLEVMGKQLSPILTPWRPDLASLIEPRTSALSKCPSRTTHLFSPAKWRVKSKSGATTCCFPGSPCDPIIGLQKRDTTKTFAAEQDRMALHGNQATMALPRKSPGADRDFALAIIMRNRQQCLSHQTTAHPLPPQGR